MSVLPWGLKAMIFSPCFILGILKPDFGVALSTRSLFYGAWGYSWGAWGYSEEKVLNWKTGFGFRLTNLSISCG